MGKVSKARDWKEEPLEINEYELDYELNRQARLFRLWARRTAAAKDFMNQCESQMELVEAQLKLLAFKKPSKFGLDKPPTVEIMKAIVVASEKYQGAVRKYNDARREYEETKVMADALGHKKSSLEKEVELFLAGYFAEPRLKGRSRDEFGKRQARRPVRAKGDR